MSDFSGQFEEKSFLCRHDGGDHKIVFNDSGNREDTPVFCVHHLTGTAADFDFLAHELIKRGFRVIALDLPGRGRSNPFEDPSLYTHDQYIRDLNALITRLGYDQPNTVNFIGVSLGGLLGIQIAAQKTSPLKTLALCDIGPDVPQEALDFIHDYIAIDHSFPDLDAYEQTLRETRGLTWGPMDDERWTHLAQNSHKKRKDGTIGYAYDRAISEQFKQQPMGTNDLWQCWENIEIPALQIWGTQSVILQEPTVKQMQERKTGEPMDLISFDDCGHVPSLTQENQITPIVEWLLAHNPR